MNFSLFRNVIRSWRRWRVLPPHLRRGQQGERAAKRYLRRQGLKFLTANYSGKHGEIDLIFRDGRELVFVEVKTRSTEDWTRPATAVNAKKKRRLSRTALAYLKAVGFPPVPFRFDIVEIIMSGTKADQIRHLPNAFPLSSPYVYGWPSSSKTEAGDKG